METSRNTCSAEPSRKVDHVELLDSAPSQTDSRSGNTPTRPRKRKRTAMEEGERLLTPWVQDLGITLHQSFEQRLHHEIVAYLSYILPTPQEKAARHQVFLAIATAIKGRFPRAEVNIFGSVAHDLCLPDSDLDICICPHEVLHPDTLKRSLFQLSHMLKSAGIASSDVDVNHWAKVPIISFKTIPDLGSFKVDVGIGNVDGVHAIDIINGYLTTIPALRPLIMVVKAFLSQRQLNSAACSGLSSYCLTCMAISFLQLNPTKLPVDRLEKPMETELLGALVVDFLLYYGSTFPYETSYISVNEGKLLLKSSAPWIQTTIPQRLAIQCLVRPDNDIAKSAGRIEVVKAAFREAHATLTSIDSSSNAILGKIIAFSQSTVDHREHVRNVVDSGRFGAALAPRWKSRHDGFGARGNYPPRRYPQGRPGSELSFAPRSPEKRQRRQY